MCQRFDSVKSGHKFYILFSLEIFSPQTSDTYLNVCTLPSLQGFDLLVEGTLGELAEVAKTTSVGTLPRACPSNRVGVQLQY